MYSNISFICVLYLSYMIAAIGEHKWWQYGKTLSRPMTELVERPKDVHPVVSKEKE